MTSGYFYTLAGKTKLKVFEGEFEGDSPRGGEMSVRTEGTARSRSRPLSGRSATAKTVQIYKCAGL